MRRIVRFRRVVAPLRAGVVLLALVTAACAPAAAPSPTAAPKAESKPTEAAKPAAPAAPAASPAAAAPQPAPAKPAPSPAAAPAAPAASPAAAAKPAASPAAAARTITLPPVEQKRVTLTHSTLEPTHLAFAIAKELKLYEKYGLENVDLVYSEGDPKSLQVLLSGGADAGGMGATTSISSQLTDTPLVTVAMTVTILTDSMVGGPNIKTAADLKGKSVAISGFGGGAHASALIGLKNAGLSAQDVTLMQVGGQSARIAAIKAGTVAAGVVDMALDDEMKAQGFNLISNTVTPPLEFARSGLHVRRDWFEKNPNTVLALTAASLEGQNVMWTDPNKAVEIFMKWAQIQDRASAQKQIAEFTKIGRRDMRWSKEGWDLAQEVLASADEAIKKIDITRAYSTEPLDKLRQLGLNDALGIPASR